MLWNQLTHILLKGQVLFSAEIQSEMGQTTAVQHISVGLSLAGPQAGGLVFTGSNPSLTSLANPSSIFSLIPVFHPLTFLAQDGAEPTELLPITFAQTVGGIEEEEDPSVLLRTTCSSRRMYCTEECWPGWNGSSNIQWSLQIFKTVFFVHLPLLNTWLPNNLLLHAISLVVPLSKFHSFLPLLADFAFYCSHQQVRLLFYPSISHPSLKHKSRSHPQSTISAASSYLMTFISFNHFLFPSNTTLLPNSTDDHMGHSTCHYSLTFFLVIISAVPSSPQL